MSERDDLDDLTADEPDLDADLAELCGQLAANTVAVYGRFEA